MGFERKDMLNMYNYKNLLAERLTQAVAGVCPEAEFKYYEETAEGFFCDYKCQPLNPRLFHEIANRFSAEGIRCACELNHFSGAYENGEAEGQILQRIYALAFEEVKKLEAHKALQDASRERNHKTIGSRMKLFSHSDEIGQGLTLWHPKGAMLRYLVESFGQKAHILNGYQWVYTPHIGRAELWKTSGHLDFYKDSMYAPIVIDHEEYYLKPMNCPFHINIYNSEIHSYRDLPVKYAEYGTVYRYELSGTLSGLTRVRGFTQDDAHIICTPEQIEEEVKSALQFSLYILRSFGLKDFQPYISTKPKNKFIGDDESWVMATDILKKAVDSSGLQYQIDEGGGAFYGPKIDLKLRDSLGREWQCSTIQFDFNLPERFDMYYIGSDGKKHAPFMVHRALFGSLERFIALLIEHYNGDFPFWLAPLQFSIIPIKESHNAYAKKLLNRLNSMGFRAKQNDSGDNMRKKIKDAELDKIPYILVIGDKEIASGGFSVRSRAFGDLGTMDFDALLEHVRPQTELGIPKYIFD